MTYERPMGRRSRSTTGLLDVRWMLRSAGSYKQVLPRRPPATLPSTSVGATRCDQGSAHVRRLSGDDRTHPVAGARAGRVKVTGPPTGTRESDRRPRVARSGRSRRPPGESPDHLGKYMGNQLIADNVGGAGAAPLVVGCDPPSTDALLLSWPGSVSPAAGGVACARVRSGGGDLIGACARRLDCARRLSAPGATIGPCL